MRFVGQALKIFGFTILASPSLVIGQAHAQSASFTKEWERNVKILMQESDLCQKGLKEGRRLITMARNSGYSNDYIAGTATGLTACSVRIGDFETVLEFAPAIEEVEELRPFAILSQALAGVRLDRAEVAYNAVTKVRREDSSEFVKVLAEDSTWWEVLRMVRSLPSPDEKAFKVHEVISWGDYGGFNATETEQLKASYLEAAILTKADFSLISQLMAGLASPKTAMRLLVDKRFDVIRDLPTFPRIQDVLAVTQARHDLDQRQIAANPDRLQPYINLAITERWMKRPDAAIATLDKAIDLAKKSPSSFQDYAETFPWLYSEKSRALESKGKFEESLAANLEAARVRKPKDYNPSQTINLALHFGRIGQHQEAIKTFDLLPGGLNDYAKALVVSARGCSSYVLSGNVAEVAKVRRSLSELGKDGQRNLISFEACIADLDRVEEVYLALLQNPETRTEALLHAQALRQPRVNIGSEAMKWDDIYRQVLTRPKVAAALAELGNPLDIPLETRDFIY